MSSDIFQHRNSAGEVVTVLGSLDASQREILSHEALEFLAYLHRQMDATRTDLLQARAATRQRLANGGTLDFEKATRKIREDDSWRVATLAPGLKDRRTELTAPAVDRKSTINALNSGAKVWIADFEDGATPVFEKMMTGQVNLFDAIRRQIDFISPEGKQYRLKKPALAQMPTIIVRPRGLHMEETHIQIDGQPVAAALVDFGLYFFHNATKLVTLGRGPYYYLPKVEHHMEARWWNKVFVRSQDYLGIPQGTVRATVMIESITAAFQMDEILYQLRDHSSGLNAGRWDYIFSIVQNFQKTTSAVLPDRAEITMDQPMMKAYSELLVRTCHRRGASAIGGVSAFIPDREDPAYTKRALVEVRADKAREAAAGFDGSWVNHPELVPTCMRAFDELLLDAPHQIRTNRREDVDVTAADLLDFASTTGDITEQGIRANIEAGIRYLASWLGGQGAVAIHGLMEDLGTAEISRSQIWQWVHTGSEAQCEDGSTRTVTREWIEEITQQTLAELPRHPEDNLDQATKLFTEVALDEPFRDTLTIPGYEQHFAAQPENEPVNL